MQFLKLTKSI